MQSIAYQDLIEKVRDVSDLEVFWGQISKALSNYGVTSMFYGAVGSRIDLKTNKTKSLVIKSSHPKEFEEYFGLDNLVDNCKSFEHALRETTPFLWHDEDYWVDVTPDQWAQANIEREMGLYVGFTLPTIHHSPNSWGAHGVSMGDIDINEFSKFWPEKKIEMIKILSILDVGMRQNYIDQIIKLSPREKQTLEYLSAGYLPEQIADHLNISASTVDKYVVSSKKKLNAKTRDHAVAKALMLNLINP